MDGKSNRRREKRQTGRPGRALTWVKAGGSGFRQKNSMDQALLTKYDKPVARYTSYPTAPHFSPDIGSARYGEWLASLAPDQPLSLYVHVPFCDTLCWFCGCHTRVVRRYDSIKSYMETVAAEAGLVAAALTGRHRLAHLHFGGGSPSILRPAEIAVFAGHVRRLFDIDDRFEFAVEIDPRDIDEQAIQAWAEAGATRASIGAGFRSPGAAGDQPRPELRPDGNLRRAVANRRHRGDQHRPHLHGPPHQTVATARSTAEQVRRCGRTGGDLGYPCAWMKLHQRLLPEAVLPGTLERLAQAEAAAAALADAGYVRIGLDHFALPEDGMAQAAGAGRLARNFQGYTTDAAPVLIGLGASSIGTLPQGYVQNEIDLRRYSTAIQEGRLATARGIVVSPEDKVRRTIIERLMCDMEADVADICANQNLPPADFAAEFEQLSGAAADGLVELAPPRIRITEQGRLPAHGLRCFR
jgi:oxygen-independent coproporphyrinogen-3 oxidase